MIIQYVKFYMAELYMDSESGD